MPTAYEEIIQMLSDIELENKIPDGTLKKIYDMESSYVHLRSRTQIHDTLQGIISDAAGKMN